MWPSHETLLPREESDGFKIPAGYDEDRETLEEDEILPQAKYTSKRVAANPQPFQFSAHRMRLDWGALYGIDPQEVVRLTSFSWQCRYTVQCV